MGTASPRCPIYKWQFAGINGGQLLCMGKAGELKSFKKWGKGLSVMPYLIKLE